MFLQQCNTSKLLSLLPTATIILFVVYNVVTFGIQDSITIFSANISDTFWFAIIWYLSFSQMIGVNLIPRKLSKIPEHTENISENALKRVLIISRLLPSVDKDIIISITTKAATASITSSRTQAHIFIPPDLFALLNNNELCAIFSHEIGHIEHRDKEKSVWFIYGSAILILLVGNAIMLTVVITAIFLLYFYMRRLNEYAADEYAVKYFGKEAFINGLKKVSSVYKEVKIFDTLPWFVELFSTHPNNDKRMRNIEKKFK